MRLPQQALGGLSRRADGTGSSNAPSSPVGMIVGIVLAGLFGVSFASWLILRRVRAHYPRPRWIPSEWLRGKWEQWQPGTVKHRLRMTQVDTQESSSGQSILARIRSRAGLTSSSGPESRSNVSHEMMVDRHTSVRSIATLPAYVPVARESEQVIGREGERAGIDTVVEFPETIDEEERRRDEEMESLYQVRIQRRAEREAREERRRRMQEARSRGDAAAIEQLRAEARQSRDARDETGSEAMLRDHRTRNRRGRLASVSYWEVGMAQPDGSRVRADSDSTQAPLLDSAASMGRRSGSRPGTATNNHSRNLSTTSLRFGTAAELSDDDGASDFEVVTPWTSQAGSAGASPANTMPASGDLGAGRLPNSEPPRYDDLGWPEAVPDEQAPPYTSPVERTESQRRRLPSLRLPSINITPFSPATSPREEHNTSNV